MEKKKVNKILKSVAGVGVALGGASAFSDGDVVFAAEQEQQTVTEEQEQVVETEQKESEAHEEHLDSTADTNETQTQESKGSGPAQSVSEDNGNVADTTKDDNSTNDVTPDNNDGADTTQNDNGNTADTETGDNGNENQSVGGETTNTDDNSTNGTENAEGPETTGNNESDVLNSVRSESLSASDSTVKSTASESAAASEHEADEARKDSETESASESASESHEGSLSGVKSDSELASQSTVTSEETKESQSESAAESSVDSTEAQNSAAEEHKSTESEKDAATESASYSASESLKSEDDSLTSVSDAASQSTSESASASATESESLSESMASTSVTLNESDIASQSTNYSMLESDAQSIFNSTSTVFKENGLEDEYLENLINQIKEAQKKVQDALQAAKDAGQHVDHKTDGNNYYQYADELANLLIQYKFYQEDRVKDIQHSEWDSSGYTNNHVKVTYTGSDGKQHTEYFDYVTADSADRRLDEVDKNKKWWESEKKENPDYIDHIYVTKKEVTSAQLLDTNGNEIETFIHMGIEQYKINGKWHNGYRTTNAEGKTVIRWGDNNELEYTYGTIYEFNGKGTSYFSEVEFNKGLDK